jgi:hypothetical protein
VKDNYDNETKDFQFNKTKLLILDARSAEKWRSAKI